MSENDETSILIGSIDQGTSSSRFLIFSAKTAKPIVSHQIELRQHFPQDGWIEMDAVDMLQATKDCIREACNKLKNMGISVNNVKAIGVTNQRETSIMWDRTTGLPLNNAIVWSDVRTSQLADEYVAKTKSKNRNEWQNVSGLPIHPYFSALKVRWMMNNVAGVKKAVKEGTAMFGTVDTWLIWNLTGGVKNGSFVTDVTNASRTMLMNIHSLKWDVDLCKFYDIPMNILPKICSSAEVYGRLTDGPLIETPISGCLGDQQAALVGQYCFQAGTAKNTYGTGCFLLYNTGNKPVMSGQGLITTVAYQFGPNNKPVYALEGSVAVAGSCIRWLRDNMNIIKSAREVEDVAKSVSDVGGVYLVPAFSGLLAPYWQPDARAVICGLSQFSKKGHIARAALEGVCFEAKDLIEAMQKDCGTRLKKLLVDGGMTQNELMMQTQADLLGCTVVRPDFVESTALGAAIAAGYAVQCWNVTQNDTSPFPEKQWMPTIDEKARSSRYGKWLEAVSKALPAGAQGAVSVVVRPTPLHNDPLFYASIAVSLATGIAAGFILFTRFAK